MKAGRCLGILVTAATLTVELQAQSPKDLVAQAVHAELAANRNDHSHWRYLQEEKLPTETLSIVVETAQGALKETIEQNGKPLTPEAAAAETKRVDAFLHDNSQQQKQRKNAEQDGQSASKLLEMLPSAFTWKLAGETPTLLTLAFAPNPSFAPPDMESRVMSAMAGELVVDRKQHRIRTMRGTLSQDVNIGYGLLGKLRQGGTFDVERREIAPGSGRSPRPTSTSTAAPCSSRPSASSRTRSTAALRLSPPKRPLNKPSPCSNHPIRPPPRRPRMPRPMAADMRVSS